MKTVFMILPLYGWEPARTHQSIVPDHNVANPCEKIGNLVESVGDNSTSFIFVLPSATYFLSAATKSRQKRPLSNAEGLAQHKSFLWQYAIQWPTQLGYHKNIRCETDSRAVRNGFN